MKRIRCLIVLFVLLPMLIPTVHGAEDTVSDSFSEEWDMFVKSIPEEIRPLAQDALHTSDGAVELQKTFSLSYFWERAQHGHTVKQWMGSLFTGDTVPFQVQKCCLITVKISGHNAAGYFIDNLGQIVGILVSVILFLLVYVVHGIPVFHFRKFDALGKTGFFVTPDIVLHRIIVMIPDAFLFAFIVSIPPGKGVAGQSDQSDTALIRPWQIIILIQKV